MTATTLQDLLNGLDDVVLQKTLSLDAYQSLVSLKQRAAATEAINDELRQTLKNVEGRNLSLVNDLQAANAKLNAIAQREVNVKLREDKMHELEIGAAVAQAESRAFRHSLGVVFASNTVRESVFNNRNHSNYDPRTGSSHSTCDSENGSVQRTEGYDNPDGSGSRANLG